MTDGIVKLKSTKYFHKCKHHLNYHQTYLTVLKKYTYSQQSSSVVSEHYLDLVKYLQIWHVQIRMDVKNSEHYILSLADKLILDYM